MAAALDPRQLQRFRIEAQAAAHLHHSAHRAHLLRRLRARRLLLRDAVRRGPQPGRRDRASSGRADAASTRDDRRARRTCRPPCRRNRAAGTRPNDGPLRPRRVLLPQRRPARHSGGRGARLCPRHGRGPSRHQAGEPAARRARATVYVADFGLAQLRDDAGVDHDRRPGRHAPLHEPRAGPGPARRRRSSHRHLFASAPRSTNCSR